jgi:hypothetical protein
MTTTRYCYHCGRSHPEEEMRLVKSKSGTRWRCVKSIQATKRTAAERDAFGKKVSAANAEARSVKQKSLRAAQTTSSTKPA